MLAPQEKTFRRRADADFFRRRPLRRCRQQYFIGHDFFEATEIDFPGPYSFFFKSDSSEQERRQRLLLQRNFFFPPIFFDQGLFLTFALLLPFFQLPDGCCNKKNQKQLLGIVTSSPTQE